jgi:hypothetical protein
MVHAEPMQNNELPLPSEFIDRLSRVEKCLFHLSELDKDDRHFAVEFTEELERQIHVKLLEKRFGKKEVSAQELLDDLEAALFGPDGCPNEADE